MYFTTPEMYFGWYPVVEFSLSNSISNKSPTGKVCPLPLKSPLKYWPAQPYNPLTTRVGSVIAFSVDRERRTDRTDRQSHFF